MSLSIVTCCSSAISMEYYLAELLESVRDLADEIVIVNGDKSNKFKNSETGRLILDTIVKNKIKPNKPMIKIYHNPWEWRLGKNMYFVQKNIALSHATCDWVLRLDSDELIHEDDYGKIKCCMGFDFIAYTFKVLHFWRDFDHIIVGTNTSDPGQRWYTNRVHLFRNNLGIHEGHDQHGNYTDSLITKDYEPLLHHPETKHTSIKIYHFGHVRSQSTYLKKKNKIEKAFHPDWTDLEEWKWDMTQTLKYVGNYPKVMKKRIEKHKKEYPQYYE